MQITYNGDIPVEIIGHDFVKPGATIEVPDEVGERLLLAGPQHIDLGDGQVEIVPPAEPLWTAASKKEKKSAAVAAVVESAEAGKEPQS